MMTERAAMATATRRSADAAMERQLERLLRILSAATFLIFFRA